MSHLAQQQMFDIGLTVRHFRKRAEIADFRADPPEVNAITSVLTPSQSVVAGHAFRL